MTIKDMHFLHENNAIWCKVNHCLKLLKLTALKHTLYHQNMPTGRHTHRQESYHQYDSIQEKHFLATPSNKCLHLCAEKSMRQHLFLFGFNITNLF